jgi:uncharacterized small protein (DUF1192 family)
MPDGLDERVAALEDEVKQLKARVDASERDRRSDMADLQWNIARLGADLANGLSSVKKDMATVIKRLGAIEATLAGLPDQITKSVGEAMRKP